MNNDLKKIMSPVIIIIGYFAFILSTSLDNFPLALIYLSLTIICWILYVMAVDIFNLRTFAYIISLSGFIIAISVFFLFGIEEVPYPIGAVIFHIEGIAAALGITLFSLFPIIPLFYFDVEKKIIPIVKNIQTTKPSIEEPKIIIDDDDWEIASEGDLQSGEFEIN